MQKTSQKIISEGFFDPIELAKDFPITRPAFHTPPVLAHVHNCFEIGLCRSGAGVFIVDEKVFSCTAGDVIFINHREFHALKDASPINSDWRFINLDPAELLAGWLPPGEEAINVSRLSGKKFANVIHEKKHPDIVFMVRKLIDELEHERDGYRSIVRSLVWGLLVMLKRTIKETDTEDMDEPAKIQRIYPALQYISTNYHEDVCVPKLAKLCHCSISTFRRIFLRSLGCLPLEYVNHFRLKVATTMLITTNHSISQIALFSGFPTLSNFNRQFRAKYNISPRDYRKASQADYRRE